MLAFTNKMYTSSTFRSLAAAANDWQSAEWQSAQAAPTTAGTTALRDPSPWNETDFDPYAGWPSPSPFPSHSTSNNNDGQQVATIAAVANDDSSDVTTNTSSHLNDDPKTLKRSFDQTAATSLSMLRRSTRKQKTLITPASLYENVSQYDSLEGTVVMPTVTPFDEHEAGVALATLATLGPPSISHAVKEKSHPKWLSSPGSNSNDIGQASFPLLVHAMVTEAAKELPELIQWIHDGEAFVIRDPSNRKLADILQKYFKHQKYSSLQRQLNIYGWKKRTKGKFKGAFHNEHFHRDRGSPSDLSAIRRRGPSKPRPSAMRTPSRKNPVRAASSSIEQNATAREEDVLNSAMNVVPEKSKGPLKYRFKCAPTPDSARAVSETARFNSSVPSPMIGQLMASPIVFDNDLSLSPVDDWSPVVERRKSPDLMEEETVADYLNAKASLSPGLLATVTPRNEDDAEFIQARHPVESGLRCLVSAVTPRVENCTYKCADHTSPDAATGSVRMTLFGGKTLATTPIQTSARVYNSMFSHTQELPSPIVTRIPSRERVPPPPPLLRHSSSQSFAPPTPLPLELKRQNSSSFFLPFVGMTAALTSALGLEGRLSSPQTIRSGQTTEATLSL